MSIGAVPESLTDTTGIGFLASEESELDSEAGEGSLLRECILVPL